MKKFLYLFLVLSLLVFSATAAAQDLELNPDQRSEPALSQGANNTAAVVNGEKITAQKLKEQLNINQTLQRVSRVDQNLAQILASSQPGSQVLERLKQAKLDNLINNLLLEQQVEKEDISLSQAEKDEIYQQQKKAIMKQNQMSEKEFASILEKQGYQNEADYKKKFSNNPQLKINKLIEKKVVSEIEISEKELKKAYNQNKNALSQSGQNISYEKIKPRLKQMLKQRQKNQAVKQYLDDLRKEAEIKKNI